MVTTRARRWVQRGIAAALVAASVVLAVATWFTSELVEEELLFVTGREAAATPATAGFEYEQVDIPGPLGNYPAWLIAGSGDEDTWAVVVHDRTSNRAEALDLLPTLAEYGIPVLIVTYRNDGGAPPSAGGHHALGADEWEDVEAAVAFAMEEGAGDVVLIGYGSGGAAVLTLVRLSPTAGRVAGVVLDSPYLDPGAMVDARTREDNLPGFLSGWGKALATFRFGVDWALLDQVAAADDLAVPILVFQGGADTIAPAWVAEAFAAARPDLVRYVEVEDAGHLAAFEADRDRYTGGLGHFLRRVAVGPSDLPEADPDTGAE